MSKSMTSLDIWFVVAIALTNATQLRFGDFPVGPGDIMLFAWILLVSMNLILQPPLITSIMRVIFLFWMVSFATLSLGFLIAESKGLTAGDFDHDAMAFLLAAIFSITFVTLMPSKEKLKKILLFFLSFTIITLSIIFFLPAIFVFFSPWYGGVRFTGWANNPNQMALQLSMIPFLCLHLFNQTSNRYIRIWSALLLITSLLFGVATGSDALTFAWVVGFLSLIVLIIDRNLLNSNRDKLSSLNRSIIKVFLVITVLITGLVLTEKLSSLVGSVYNEEGSQGGTRITLWINGITAISNSPIFGLGPGSQSGFDGPFSDFEAHNTFIDWGGDSGIVGLICYVSLIGWVGWHAWKNRLVVLVAAMVSLVGFSMFHYVLRPPIFWFYLLTIAKLSMHSLKESDLVDNSMQQTKKLPELRY